ncbi:MAG TPA: NUDIX domain-containing protein [Aliidongia sp.]|nr:NUDIX domain-containing protein [Aliidongia sp.]
MDEQFTIIGRERAHDGFLQLDVCQVRQRRFDGALSPVLEREILVQADCVGILLYDPAADAVVLVEQARLPALLRGYPAIQAEIVAGRLEPGETAIDVARREVAEETGCVLQGEPELITTSLTSPGYNLEQFHLFYAAIDSTKAGGIHGVAAEHEDIRVLVLPYDEFRQRQADGCINNVFTLYAGLWLDLNRARLRGG